MKTPLLLALLCPLVLLCPASRAEPGLNYSSDVPPMPPEPALPTVHREAEPLRDDSSGPVDGRAGQTGAGARDASFNEVLGVLESRRFVPQTALQGQEFLAYGPAGISGGVRMPHYSVNFLSLGGLLSSPLVARAKQTLVDHDDYYPYLRKLVHANGVCVTGVWQVNQNSPYSGYFRKGTSGLFIGRISVALNETTAVGPDGKQNSRGFGFAGKIFPTMNPSKPVHTTNFLTVDVLSGTPAPTFLGTNLTNDPPLKFGLDLAGELAKIVPAFLKADTSPTFRPVTQLAAASPDGGALRADQVKAPVWMRLRPAPGTLTNAENDFRTEVVRAVEQNNEKLKFVIEVSSSTNDRNAQTGWAPVGAITVDRALVSMGCDRQLHFQHPKDDHSKPAGAP